METYERPHGKTLLARLREEPRWLIIVTGPRQTGKTTLVEQVLRRVERPSVHVAVDAPDPSIFPVTTGFRAGAVASTAADISLPPIDRRDTRWLVRTWEEARLEARASDRGFVLALDEIQKVPNWSETVKGLWDADRRERLPLHVVLLGSAPLLMQRGMSESLAGRYEVIDVEHWSFAEMAAAFDFDLDRFIYFGGYPGPAPLIRDETRWRSFIHRSLIEPNIERDILALQRVDKPILLKQLFGLGAACSGQILSYNKMLGQLDEAGNTTTLARYLDLLSKAGLIAGLSKYASRPHRRRASSPKLNVLNTALMSVHADYTFEQARADRTFWGHLVESAVGAHLVNTGYAEYRVYYWRDRGREVDFVLEHGRKLVAFEVKSGKRRGNVRGLEAFGRSFSVKASHIVGQGGIPISEFLLTPASEWFIERDPSRVTVHQSPRSVSEALAHYEPIAREPITPKAPPAPTDDCFDEVRATVLANLTPLRANRCPHGLVHRLAVAYLDGFSDVRGATPRDRLRYLLGPDHDLLNATLAGLRGAIHREDLPAWTEMLRLAAEGRTHYLAYPFMVGLEELARTSETEVEALTEAQVRLALSIHLAAPRLRHAYDRERPPRWLRTAVARHPLVVAEVWSHCAREQLRKGTELPPDIRYMAHEAEYAGLAAAVSIPLLRIFPVRCRAGQLTVLSSLLQGAVLHGDRAQLVDLIEVKLALTSMNPSQTVYWLTAGLFVKPEVYGDRLASYVLGRSRRIHRLMEMTVAPHGVPRALRDMWNAPVLETLIRLLGPYAVSLPNTGVDARLANWRSRLAATPSDSPTPPPVPGRTS